MSMSRAVFTASFVRLQTMADGTPRLIIDADCSLAEIAKMGLTPGASFAFARMTQDAAQQAQQHRFEQQSAPYGKEAQALHRTGFFRTPEVWRAVGTDEQFRAWLREQSCRKCGSDAPNQAAHVRSVAAGSGTNIKPGFHAIALCDTCHNHVQHDQGICALTGEPDKYKAREILNRWAIEAVEAWCKIGVKARLGYDHLNEMPPVELLAWAEKKGIDRYLPEEYRQ